MLQKALKCGRESLKARTSFMLFQKSKEKIVLDEGFHFCIHYFDETNYVHHNGVQKHESSKEPLLPPYPPHCFVSHLTNNSANHYCFINLYQTSLGHIVISCANPSSKQTENLNKSDCTALSQVIQGYNRTGIAYFNYGLESGCSQMHKHMQYTTLTYNPIFNEMKRAVSISQNTLNNNKNEKICSNIHENNKIYLNSKLGIKFFGLKLPNDEPIDIYDNYNKLLEQFYICCDEENKIYNRNSKKNSLSYNFVISEGYAILVPRRLSVHPTLRVSLNSLGVSGHYFLWEGYDQEIVKNPIKVLRDLCVTI